MEDPNLRFTTSVLEQLDKAARAAATSNEEMAKAMKTSAENEVGERGPGLYAVQNPVTGKVHFVSEGSEEDRLVPQRNRADRRRSLKSHSISKADREAIKAAHRERQAEINAAKRRLKAIMSGQLTADSKPVEE